MEQRLYLRVHKEAKAEFQKHVSYGSNHVARNLLAIMSLLGPLRAICSGGVLRERVTPWHTICMNETVVMRWPPESSWIRCI